jgi:hypothetical protein
MCTPHHLVWCGSHPKIAIKPIKPSDCPVIRQAFRSGLGLPTQYDSLGLTLVVNRKVLLEHVRVVHEKLHVGEIDHSLSEVSWGSISAQNET